MVPDPEKDAHEAPPPRPEPGSSSEQTRPTPADRADAGVVLPRDVQEHLGQQLRTEYDVVAEKPAFLGDPALPEQFDWHITRLETRERAHTQAVEAVEKALEDIVWEQAEPEADEPGERSDEG